MESASLQQEPPQHASVFYHENPVTQQMLLCAANQACAYASQAAAACTVRTPGQNGTLTVGNPTP